MKDHCNAMHHHETALMLDSGKLFSLGRKVTLKGKLIIQLAFVVLRGRLLVEVGLPRRTVLLSSTMCREVK